MLVSHLLQYNSEQGEACTKSYSHIRKFAAKQTTIEIVPRQSQRIHHANEMYKYHCLIAAKCMKLELSQKQQQTFMKLNSNNKKQTAKLKEIKEFESLDGGSTVIDSKSAFPSVRCPTSNSVRKCGCE